MIEPHTSNDSEALLKMIKSQLDTLPDFGQLQLHIKKHVGSFSNTDVMTLTSYRYAKPLPEEANADCATDVWAMVKGIQQAEMTGSLGFSITFKKGKAELMQVQNFKKL